MDFSWGKKGSFLGIGCSVDSLEQRETKKEGFAWKTALGKGNPTLKIPGFSGGGFEAFQNPVIHDFPASLRACDKDSLPGIFRIKSMLSFGGRNPKSKPVAAPWGSCTSLGASGSSFPWERSGTPEFDIPSIDRL